MIHDTPILITIKEVMAITRLGKTTIYKLLDASHPSYDSSFPRQVKLSNKSLWDKAEIHAWIESKKAARCCKHNV